MPKDRYNFDTEFHIEDFKTKSYDDSILSTEKDATITARREARKAKLAKEADKKIITEADIEMGKKKKRKKINARRFVLGIAMLALVGLFVFRAGVNLFSRQAEKREAEKRLEALNEQIEQLEAELQELESDEYIENAARENLHMINDGEVMYIVNPSLKEEDSGKTKAK